MCNRALHHELFLGLLRFTLLNKIPDYGQYRNLNETVWKNIMTTAQEQALLGVCYPTLALLPPDCRPSQNIYLTWAAKANYIRQDNKKKLKVLSEVLTIFNGKDIHPVVMKGFSSAILYPQPDLRISGDIDLFIPEKYKEAVELIESLGFKLAVTHKHHKFYYNEVLIELHHEIINLPFQKIRKYNVHEVNYSDIKFNIFDETTTAILLLTHAVTHLIGPGLGFRHLSDLALLNYKSSFIESELFKEYIINNSLERIVEIFKGLIDNIQFQQSVLSKEICYIEKDIFRQGDCGKSELKLRSKEKLFIVYYRALLRYLKFIRYDKITAINILKYRLKQMFLFLRY